MPNIHAYYIRTFPFIIDKLLFMKVFGLLQLGISYLLMLLFSQFVLASQDLGAMNPETLLISYSERNNLTRPSDQGFTINIYRNGEVSVFIPETMKQSGQYHAFLEQDKLDALWMLLIDEKVLTFDAQSVRKMLIKEQQLLKQSRAVLTTVSDKAMSVFEFYPNRHAPQGLAGEDDDVVKRVTWTGLRWDAEHYPHIEQLQLLYEVQNVILSILNRDDLRRIDQ